jgi:hypothetical protein
MRKVETSKNENFMFRNENGISVFYGKNNEEMDRWLSDNFEDCYFTQNGRRVKRTEMLSSSVVNVMKRTPGGMMEWYALDEKMRNEMTKDNSREAVFNWNLRKNDPLEASGWLEKEIKEREKAQNLKNVDDVLYEDADYEEVVNWNTGRVERRKVQRVIPGVKKKKIKRKPRPDDDYCYHSFGRTLKERMVPGAPFELRKKWNKAHNGKDFWRWAKEDSVGENMSTVDIWKVDHESMMKREEILPGGIPILPK